MHPPTSTSDKHPPCSQVTRRAHRQATALLDQLVTAIKAHRHVAARVNDNQPRPIDVGQKRLLAAARRVRRLRDRLDAQLAQLEPADESDEPDPQIYVEKSSKQVDANIRYGTLTGMALASRKSPAKEHTAHVVSQ